MPSSSSSSGSGSGSGSTPSRTLVTRLSRALLYCHREASLYGTCIKSKIDTMSSKEGGSGSINIHHKMCDSEFQKFKQCFNTYLKTQGKKR
jgi:hypothetical protein